MDKAQINTQKLIDFIGKKFESDEINNDTLVQICELCGKYLNLQTISDYAKANHLSYNGVKNHRKTVSLFNQKFVIDNK